MPTENHSIRPARQYTAAIERSDHYLEAKSNLTEFESSRRAFGKAALRFVAEREEASPYLDLDTQAVRLVGLLDDYSSSEHAMDAIKARASSGEHVDKAEKIPHLTRVIKFNHAVRELIDTQPSLTPSDLLQFVGEAAIQLGDDTEEARYIVNKLRLVIVGMQHEIVAEQALWTIDGVEDVIHADEEDELHGIDLKVVYNDSIVCLDIKSTERAQNEAWQKPYANGKTTVVWSGIQTKDLHHSFRAAPDKVASAADHLQYVLDSIVQHRRSVKLA